MRLQLGFGGALALGVVAALGVVGVGGMAVKTLDDRIKDLTEKLDQRTGEAIRAVPGERLLQMYDGLFGPDDKRRKDVKDVLTRMLNTDPTKPYTAMVSLGFDVTATELQAQVFTAPSNAISEVQSFFAPNSKANLAPIKGVIRRGATREEFRKELGDAFADARRPSATRKEVETYLKRRMRKDELLVFGPYGALGPDSISVPEATPANISGSTPAMKSIYTLASQIERDRWANAVMLLMDDSTRPIPGDFLTVPWKPLNGDQFLFVAIREVDLDAHMNDPCTNRAQNKSDNRKGCIRLWVRDDAASADPIPGTQAIDVDLEEFALNEPVDNPVKSQGKIRWVARDLNTGSALDARTLEAMKARRELLHALDEEKSKSKS